MSAVTQGRVLLRMFKPALLCKTGVLVSQVNETSDSEF